MSKKTAFIFRYTSIFTIMLISLSSLSFFLNLYFYGYFLKQNKVVEVVDGDTFQLYSGKRVRLMGVDSPELSRCAGPEAKEELEKLVNGKIVNLKEEVSETYGRSLALVYIGDTLVNQVMLEEGWGRTDYRKNSKRNLLTAAFHKAQAQKKGVWSDLCRTQDMFECDIKGNIDKNTYQKFYHLPGYLHYDEVIIEKDIGEAYFCTEEEAIQAGFKKAAGCE